MMFRHKKTGGAYAVLNPSGGLQTARPIVDGALLVTYRGADGQWWHRPVHEFHDGRFEAMPAGSEEGSIISRVDVDPLSKAARDVLAERRRQVEAEGWTAEHDDRANKFGALADAAVCYAAACKAASCSEKERAFFRDPALMPAAWPYRREHWKSTTARRDAVKAAALLLAEIERLDRLDAAAGKEAAE